MKAILCFVKLLSQVAISAKCIKFAEASNAGFSAVWGEYYRNWIIQGKSSYFALNAQ